MHIFNIRVLILDAKCYNESSDITLECKLYCKVYLKKKYRFCCNYINYIRDDLDLVLIFNHTIALAYLHVISRVFFYQSSLLTHILPYIPSRSRSARFRSRGTLLEKKEKKKGKKTHKRTRGKRALWIWVSSCAPRKTGVVPSSLARKIRVSRFRPDNVRARPRQLMAFDF